MTKCKDKKVQDALDSLLRMFLNHPRAESVRMIGGYIEALESRVGQLEDANRMYQMVTDVQKRANASPDGEPGPSRITIDVGVPV